MWKSGAGKGSEIVTRTLLGVLSCLETRRQRLVSLEGDIVERCSQGVPTFLGCRLRPHNVGLGRHPHCPLARWTAHEANLDFYRSSRLDPPRAKEKDAARTDVRRAKGLLFELTLSRDTLQAQWQAEFGARVAAPLLYRTYGMRRNARNALGLGPRRPRWRVHDARRRLRREFLVRRGIAAGGIGFAHEFWISSSAHRFRWLLGCWHCSVTLSTAANLPSIHVPRALSYCIPPGLVRHPAIAVLRSPSRPRMRVWSTFVCVSPKCRPCRGFLAISVLVSHGFPFTLFRACAVGYVVASLRDSRQHGIGPLPRMIQNGSGPSKLIRF